MLYGPDKHETVTDTGWDEDRARAGIQELVAEACTAVAPDGLWPRHERDAREGVPEELTTLWMGAAGVIWALAELAEHAEVELDLAELAERALERYLERPDFGERVPTLFAPSLWMGETGIRVAAFRATAREEHAERVLELVRANAANETNDLMWGSPGTMLAARALLDSTGDERFQEAWDESARTLWSRWEDDGFWTQRLYGREVRSVGPGHGFAANVRALMQGWERADEIRARAAPAVEAAAVREDGLANWPMAVGEPLDAAGEIRTQWCHGAPGIVATLWDVASPELVVAGGELTWKAGPLTKGAGLCHGTAGNGYAFLKLHELTGETRWLDRARAFAMHAIEQVERARAERGRGWYSLFTGDIGVALYLRACLDEDARFPTIDLW
jgi:Lanthionine synthetase C-like protein